MWAHHLLLITNKVGVGEQKAPEQICNTDAAVWILRISLKFRKILKPDGVSGTLYCQHIAIYVHVQRIYTYATIHAQWTN